MTCPSRDEHDGVLRACRSPSKRRGARIANRRNGSAGRALILWRHRRGLRLAGPHARHAVDKTNSVPLSDLQAARRALVGARRLTGQHHGTTADRRRPPAGRHGADLRREERLAAADRRLAALRRAADADERAGRRRHQDHAHADGALRRRHRPPHGARGDAGCGRRRATSRRPTTSCGGCARRSSCSARCWRASAMRRVSHARRLRHRRAAGRPAPQGARRPWARRSRSTAATSTRSAPNGLTGARIVFASSVGRRDRDGDDGGDARPSGETEIVNAAREPEVGDLARVPRRDGRADRGRRHAPHPGQGGADACAPPATRSSPTAIEAGTYAIAAAITGGAPGTHGRAAGAPRRRSAQALEAAGVQIWPTDRGLMVSRTGRAEGHRHHDRALSRLPDRPAGAVHGADVHRRRRLDDPRDGLREPLHARAGARRAWARNINAAGHDGAGARRREAARARR